MGAFMYVNELWKKKGADCMKYNQRVRAWQYRHSHAVVRLNRPTRPDKARMLGWKAKQGFSVFRIRIRRGGRKRIAHKGITYGKPKTSGITGLKLNKNHRQVAEQRLGSKFGNLRVLNSYWSNTDAVFTWYEVICADPSHPAIRNDPRSNWVVNAVHKHREARGLTSSGRKGRGLRNKGHGASRLRPSVRAAWRRNNRMTFLRKR